MTITEQTMTLDEFLALPDEKPALEWEDGRITQKMPPDQPHGVLQSHLAASLIILLEPGGQLLVATELRWTLAPRFSRVPDVVVYRRDRAARDARGRLRHVAITEPPEMTVEIISPGETTASQLRRCEQFVAAGVKIALLVDPDEESVGIVRRDRTMHVVRGPERIDLGEVLPGIDLTAEQLFESLRLD